MNATSGNPPADICSDQQENNLGKWLVLSHEYVVPILAFSLKHESEGVSFASSYLGKRREEGIGRQVT